jgi:hypothetical protein
MYLPIIINLFVLGIFKKESETPPCLAVPPWKCTAPHVSSPPIGVPGRGQTAPGSTAFLHISQKVIYKEVKSLQPHIAQKT